MDALEEILGEREEDFDVTTDWEFVGVALRETLHRGDFDTVEVMQ